MGCSPSSIAPGSASSPGAGPIAEERAVGVVTKALLTNGSKQEQHVSKIKEPAESIPPGPDRELLQRAARARVEGVFAVISFVKSDCDVSVRGVLIITLFSPCI